MLFRSKLIVPSNVDSCKVLTSDAQGNASWQPSSGGSSIDTTSLSNRIDTKLNESDTASLSARINLKLNSTDTSSLSNRIDLRVPYTGANQDVDLGANNLNAQSISITGTNGNGHIHLKHQASDATATGSSTSLFANSNGDLKWKNEGNYYTTLTTQQTADRAYTFQNKSYTLADSSDVANKVNISDTSTMLSKYLRKTDTSSLSSRIDTKLNASDSSIYYTKYRSDTSRTNIYNALIGKQSSLTFSTGLTNTSGTITNNLSVGVSGGQTIIGGKIGRAHV